MIFFVLSVFKKKEDLQQNILFLKKDVAFWRFFTSNIFWRSS
jgi:hypothetical protein